MKRIVYIAIMVLALMSVLSSVVLAEEADTVVLLEVQGEVNAAMAAYIDDAITQAEENGTPVVLIIDTYGGQIIEADNIKKSIMQASVPVDCYITRNALSAGVLISISCENIVMGESAVIGAAETIPNDEKTLATWVGILESAAEARGRDTQVIAAMADKRIQIEGVTTEDELLTLGASKAAELGISDGTASNTKQALEILGYEGFAMSEKNMSFPVRAAQFLTSTAVASILFLAAIVCMGMEIFTPGFGVFGVISIVCFLLYFGGSFLAGFAEWWSLALLGAGLVFFAIEVAVPGFGVFGILGIVCVAAGLLFASRDIKTFLIVLSVGLVGAIIALPLLFKLLKKLGLTRKLFLVDNMEAEQGYVSHEHIDSLVGKSGVAMTILRPAGTAKIDGLRQPVLSSGAYIDKGDEVVVVEHTPGRIVVEKKD
ncbi:MAG: nodulation protein NfeD [Clostridia bacterium]|nr:nodulation protein NfeD [Clostridia bacterium]